MDATYPINFPPGNTKILGYSDILNFNQNLSEDQWTTKVNFDATPERNFCETSLGYGKYRIDFYEGPDQDNFTFVDYCIIDYSDANYGKSIFQGEQKIRIDFRPLNEITFNFLSSTIPNNINLVGKNIRVWEQYGSGFPAVAPSKGMFNDTTLAQYHNFPIDAKQFGAIEHLTPGDFGLNMAVKYTGANIRQNQILNFNKSELTINDGIIFPVNQTSEINFTGEGAKFTAKNNSQVIVPTGFLINLNDSANINLDGTKLTTNSSVNQWRGIRLMNVGNNSYIQNSTIENADTAVYMLDQLTRPFTFKSNTVNLTRSGQGYRSVLNFRNAYNFLISENEFNLPALEVTGNYKETAIHIANYQNLTSGSRSSINIKDNKFYNGYHQLNLLAYTSNLIPVYVSGNVFSNSFTNIIGRKCIGDIKNNEFTNTVPIPSFPFTENCITNYGHLNYYGNQFQSPQYNILSGYQSYSNLAPIRDNNNEFVWTGGMNNLVNNSFDNIYTYEIGYVYTNEGRNNFTVSNSSYRHIYGELIDTSIFYYANNNCWYGNNNQANIDLFNSLGDPVPYEAIPSPNCNFELGPEGLITFDKGFGIIDSMKTSNSGLTNPASDAEKKYAESIKEIASNDLNSALNNLKAVITDYNDSRYSGISVYKVYDLYCSKDTMEIQSVTNQLFGELKSFLENRIQENSNNEDFVKLACEVILMCDVKMKNYNTAMTGYEYIALNDPNFLARISAGLEYLSVSSLINGTGGGIKSKMHKDNLPVNKALKIIYSKKVNKSKSNKIGVDERKNYDRKVNEILNSSMTLTKEDKIKLIENETLAQMNTGKKSQR
ncbi:MAG: hypothetical protein SGI89_00105 [bacterium]|nr:hypothetical protein [bacterium]